MSAVDFLFTPTVQRVLAVALMRPQDSFTLQELLRHASSGRGSAQLQIDRLVDAGVLMEEPRRGRQRCIRANTSFFLYPELRGIATKTFGVAGPVGDALRPHARRIQQAFIFGSVAKGSDDARSDLDVMIIGSVPQLELFEAESQLHVLLGRPVRFNVYEPAEWESLVRSDPVIRQIARGPKLDVTPGAQTS